MTDEQATRIVTVRETVLVDYVIDGEVGDPWTPATAILERLSDGQCVVDREIVQERPHDE